MSVENLRFNDQSARDASAARLTVGKYVKDVHFTGASKQPLVRKGLAMRTIVNVAFVCAATGWVLAAATMEPFNPSPPGDLPSFRISGDRNLALGSIPCIMTKGRPVRDEAAIRALGGTASATFYSDGGSFPVSKESARLDIFMNKLVQTVRKDRRMFFVDGQPVVASINWLRDHVHEMKAYRHWESDLLGYLNFAITHQNPRGYFYEIIKPLDDPHTTFVGPECVWTDPTNHLAFIRLELEADIEYLVVEGAVRAYKATGDETWMRRALPALEKAVNYCTSDPKRWDPGHGLMKRPFTIDTWDFVYGVPPTNRMICADTPMSIMHGDNSGLYQAMRQLGWLNRRFGNIVQADAWDARAATLKTNLDKTCFNGRFYAHQVHLNHSGAAGVDERQILSLSNAYDINRGATTFAQAQSILDEFQTRRKTVGTFAEWFSVNPPYAQFGNTPKNRYINGGIASFTAGELAKAAFKNGREAYGWDILTRLQALVERDDALYFLYHPETGKNLGGGPSGWGAASILDAIDEGLAGIEDTGACFDRMAFSPRWPVTGMAQVRYITGYECSKTLVETVYRKEADHFTYWLMTPAHDVACHLLLPAGTTSCKTITLNGAPVKFALSKVNDSVYADFFYARQGLPFPRTAWTKQTPDVIEVAW